MIGMLASLGTLTLYLPIILTITSTPLLHHRNQWAHALLHRFNGSIHIMRWWECVKGKQGDSGHGMDPSCRPYAVGLLWQVL